MHEAEWVAIMVSKESKPNVIALNKRKRVGALSRGREGERETTRREGQVVTFTSWMNIELSPLTSTGM